MSGQAEGATRGVDCGLWRAPSFVLCGEHRRKLLLTFYFKVPCCNFPLG